jgi:Domain of unknown function (DUF4333)
LGERLLCKQEVAGSIPAGSMTMPRMLAVLAIAALALIGCGGTEIDAGKTEDLIEDNVTGPPPSSVKCPEGVEAKKGETFECELTYEDRGPATVTVHIVDDDGRVRFGPGDFRFRK